jgi:hypothetical protein
LFRPGFEEIGGATERPDSSVYKALSMQGGMAYTRERLELILSDYFDVIEIRHMRECGNESATFGKPFLWASLWKKKHV